MSHQFLKRKLEPNLKTYQMQLLLQRKQRKLKTPAHEITSDSHSYIKFLNHKLGYQTKNCKRLEQELRIEPNLRMSNLLHNLTTQHQRR